MPSKADVKAWKAQLVAQAEQQMVDCKIDPNSVRINFTIYHLMTLKYKKQRKN